MLHERLLRKRQDGPFAPDITQRAGELAEKIQRLTRAADAPPSTNPSFAPSEADSITIERLLFKRRGGWYQLPRDYEPTDD